MSEKFAELFSRASKAPQKSVQWLQARHSIITSSEVASALECNTHESSLELLKRKCSPMRDNELVTSSSIDWGVKYEPVAKKIFERITDTTSTDIGLVYHKKFAWLGASPDGIVSDGRLLEIKCPYHRKIIHGKIPYYYWIQVQVQMEVCDFNESYFFQCQFEEAEMNFIPVPKQNNVYKGTHENGTNWFLRDFTLEVIKRDRNWFETSLPMLQEFWNKIEHYRYYGLGKLMSDIGNQQLYYNIQTHKLEVLKRSLEESDQTETLNKFKLDSEPVGQLEQTEHPEEYNGTIEEVSNISAAKPARKRLKKILDDSDSDEIHVLPSREDNLEDKPIEASFDNIPIINTIESLNLEKSNLIGSSPAESSPVQSNLIESSPVQSSLVESSPVHSGSPMLFANLISGNYSPSANKSVINWDEWISATSVRNYLMNEPLLDWLNIYGKGTKKQLTGNTMYDIRLSEYEDDIKDASPFFQHLQVKGVQFEDAVVANLYKKFPGEIITIANQYQARQLEKVNDTIAAMKKGMPLIYQAVLHNKNDKTYGIVDLLVRSDYLNKIVLMPVIEEKEASKSCAFSKNWHYRIVDIKHSTLLLRADGIHLLNQGSIPAYKGQLLIYNRALNQVQKTKIQQAYILGRKWSYATKGDKYYGEGWFDKFGVLDYSNVDSEIVQKTDEAIQWLREVRLFGQNWSINPPSREELYPNMCNEYDSPWHSTKKEMANQIGEITSIWYCSYNNRNNALAKGIKSWRNPKCTSNTLGINGKKISPIVDKILEINRSKSLKIMPKKLSMNLPAHKLRLFVDFETVNDLLEDINPDVPRTTSSSYLFMIGIGWASDKNPKWQYKCLTSDLIDGNNEKELFLSFHDTMLEILEENDAFDDFVVYHWSNAERTVYDATAERYYEDLFQYKEFIQWNWFDLCQLFRDEPIVVNGAFDFSLKSIAPAMYKHGFIKTQWDSDGILDGLNAMVKAMECSLDAKNKGISMTELPVMKKIMEYNEIDCKVMWEILNYINKYMIEIKPRESPKFIPKSPMVSTKLNKKRKI